MPDPTSSDVVNLSDLVITRRIKDEVWQLQNPETGELFYAKRVSASEQAMSLKAQEFQSSLNENSILQMPEVVDGDGSLLPSSIRTELANETINARFGEEISEIIVTRAVPGDAVLSMVGTPELLEALGGKPITAAEYDQLSSEVRAMNAAGVMNDDMLSNAHIVRGEDGTLRAYAYDFDPVGINRGESPEADVDIKTFESVRKYFEEQGIVEPASAAVLSTLPDQVAAKGAAQASPEALPLPAVLEGIDGVQREGDVILFNDAPILALNDDGKLEPAQNMRNFGKFISDNPDVRSAIIANAGDEFGGSAVQTADKQSRKQKEKAIKAAAREAKADSPAPEAPLEPLVYAFEQQPGEREVREGKDARFRSFKPVEELRPGMVITVAGAEHFSTQGKLSDRVSKNIRFAYEAHQTFDVPIENCASFVMPKMDQVDTDALTTRFVDELLLPKVSQSQADGPPLRLPVEQAAENMRISIISHSFGGQFVSEIGEKLSGRMQDIGYTPEEIQRVSQQVLQVDYAPSMPISMESFSRTPQESPFNRVQFFGANDRESRGTVIEVSETGKLAGHHTFELDTNLTTQRWGSEFSGAHDRVNYDVAIAADPQLRGQLSQMMGAPILTQEAGQTLGENTSIPRITDPQTSQVVAARTISQPEQQQQARPVDDDVRATQQAQLEAQRERQQKFGQEVQGEQRRNPVQQQQANAGDKSSDPKIIRLEGFTPESQSLAILQQIEGAGFENPMLHGGALRDDYLRNVTSLDVPTKDYDIRVGVDTQQMLGDARSAEEIAQRLTEHAEKAFPGSEIQHVNGQLNADGTLFLGKIELRDSKGSSIEMTLVDQSAASQPIPEHMFADSPLSNIAMDARGNVYADADFVAHAQERIYQPYKPIPPEWVESDPRLQRLSDKIPGLEHRVAPESPNPSVKAPIQDTQTPVQDAVPQADVEASATNSSDSPMQDAQIPVQDAVPQADVEASATNSSDSPTQDAQTPVQEVADSADKSQSPDTPSARTSSNSVSNKSNTFRLTAEADFHNPAVGRAYGVAGLLNRINDSQEHGATTLDKTAIVVDIAGLSTSANGNAAGLLGNVLGVASQAQKGYEAGGSDEAAYQGTKAAAASIASAEILAPGSTLSQIKQLKDLPGAVRNIPAATTSSVAALKNAGTTIKSGQAVAQTLVAAKGSLTLANLKAVGGSGANFAGRMGLVNSAITVASDSADYATGRKELTFDNATGTSLDTIVNLDPIKAVTGIAGLTKLVGVDTGVQHISISSIVDKGLGTVGLTEGKGEQIGDIKNETQGIYTRENKRFQAGEQGRQRSDNAAPSMEDYKHLAAIKFQLARHTPNGKIDGYNVGTEFDQIDMTKPENYMSYKTAINRAMFKQEKIMEKNSSWTPRWLRGGESAHKYNEAESQHNLLAAAEKEFGMFEDRMIQFNRAREAEAQIIAQREAENQAFVKAVGTLDTDQDGQISLTELDRNQDGKLDKADLAEMEKIFGPNGKALVDKVAASLKEQGVAFDGTQIDAVTGASQTPQVAANPSSSQARS